MLDHARAPFGKGGTGMQPPTTALSEVCTSCDTLSERADLLQPAVKGRAYTEYSNPSRRTI
jgi:hypothetical protein